MSHDPVNHPSHYQSESGVECIDVAEHLSFNLGNAFKYVFRREGKGALVQDLEKARWYIARERLRRRQWDDATPAPPAGGAAAFDDMAWAITAGETGDIGVALWLISHAAWSHDGDGDLVRADLILAQEIARLRAAGVCAG